MAAPRDDGFDASTLSAADVLPPNLQKGPGFEVADEVHSTGNLNTYELKTDWGNFAVVGTDLLRLRVHEIAALRHIEEMEKSDVFLDAAEKAAMSPVRAAKSLIHDPVNTLEQTAKGVGSFVGNIGSSLFGSKEETTADEDKLQALIGFYAYKRKFAYDLDVDPYTTFEPLQSALTDICWTGFAGGMTVKAAFIAVPGPSGMALSISSSSESFKAALRDKTPQQLV